MKNFRKKRLLLPLLLCLCLVWCALPVSAAKPTCILQMEPNPPKVGENLTLTVIFRGTDLGAVEAVVTYDPTKLGFNALASTGAVHGSADNKLTLSAVAEEAGQSTLQCKVVFTPIRAEYTAVRVNLVELYDFDKELISKDSAIGSTVKMTIAPGAGGVTNITEKTDATTTTPTLPATEGGYTVAPVDGYAVLTPDETIQTPGEGYREVELRYGEETVPAWVVEAQGDDLLLVYASHEDGTPAWYLLSRSRATFTLHGSSETRTTAVPTTPTTTMTAPTEGPGEPPQHNPVETPLLVVLIVAVAIALFTVVRFVVLVIRLRHEKKNAKH